MDGDGDVEMNGTSPAKPKEKKSKKSKKEVNGDVVDEKSKIDSQLNGQDTVDAAEGKKGKK